MTKKEYLLQLLEKVAYQVWDPFDNMTNALIGLVESVGIDDRLLVIVEWIITQSMKQTLSQLEQEKMDKAMIAVQRIKQLDDDITDASLDNLLAHI